MRGDLLAIAALLLLGGGACTPRQALRASAGSPHTLYLARHGQTAWNRVHRFQGDPDLDPVGFANRLSLWLLLRQERDLQTIFTSSLRRTQTTALLVAREHSLPIQPRAALDEINSGVLAGLCYASVEPEAKHPGANDCLVPSRGSHPEPALAQARSIWARARAQGLHGRVPQGESYDDLVQRARPFVEGELARALRRGKVLIVGHGVINRVLLHLLVGWPLATVAALRQQNDQVYRIEGASSATPRVSRYTPNVGWQRCTAPAVGQRELDCRAAGTTD